MRKGVKTTITYIAWYLILIFFFILCVEPVVWMVFGSFKDRAEFYANIWGPPKVYHFENYVKAWNNAGLGRKILNSIFVTFFALLISIPVNSCAAYVLARMRFKYAKLIYFYLLTGIMIPSGIMAIPTFSVALRINLVNSLFGLVLIFAAQSIAMGMFIMRSFFISLPKGLEEAALIDGCTRFKCFTHIILPLTKPGIMTQVIFSGLTIWNEYLLSSIMIRSENLQTIPLGLASFVGKYTVNYPELFAALVIVTVPVIIIYILAQKSFIEGLSAGAIKG
ncbi:MAG: carbohydrate ABC transporter permease [Firmicutes bacterium]|jgi:ABC-type glycerol-3-phosphate transport system permease component|nr:carbohydrate ABC transporter permease [Bacillota bacterium]